MNEFNAQIVKMLAGLIESIESGRTCVGSMATLSDYAADYITFQPLGSPAALRKTSTGTTTTELKLKLISKG